MKKIFAFVCCTLGLVISSQAAVSLQLAGGFLKTGPNSTTLTPQGSGELILVASTIDSTFNLPSTAGYASGDDVVLSRLAITGDGNNSGSLTAGEFSQTITADYAAFANLSAGDPLMMYWYPTLSLTDTVPTANAPYGSYRSATANADGSEAWVAPADQSFGYLLLFVTQDAGSSVNTATSGIPFGQTNATVVPEPSTYLASVLALLCLIPVARRRQKARLH